MTKYVLLLGLALLCAACTGQSPSGPTTNINGDDNDVVVGGSGQDSKVGNVTRPAPVVVEPVVVVPGPEEPA